MTSTYFGATELSEVKNDLDITGTGEDSTLNAYSDDVEGKMHDKMFEVAEKARLLDQLPVLPLTGGKITNSIKEACKEGVKAKYYEKAQHDLDTAKYHWGQMDKAVSGWISRQNVTKVYYGRVIN